jgi:hypothetical protein
MSADVLRIDRHRKTRYGGGLDKYFRTQHLLRLDPRIQPSSPLVDTQLSTWYLKAVCLGLSQQHTNVILGNFDVLQPLTPGAQGGPTNRAGDKDGSPISKTPGPWDQSLLMCKWGPHRTPKVVPWWTALLEIASLTVRSRLTAAGNTQEFNVGSG